MSIACAQCIRKHLSEVGSYMREVLDGHGEGSNPDHRFELEGELNNAEKHAQSFDLALMGKLRTIRKRLESTLYTPTINDLLDIRAIYYHAYTYDTDEVISEELIKRYDDIEICDLTTIISNRVGDPFRAKKCSCNKSELN